MSGPNNLDKDTALYYALIAIDKMVLNCKIRLKYLRQNKITKEEDIILTDLIQEYDEVKEYLKEKLT